MNLLSLFTIPLLCHVTWGCCTPKQWSGNMDYLVGSSAGLETGIEKVYYDAKNTKIASIFDIHKNGALYKGQVVMDYEKKVQYAVVDGRCNTTRLKAKFPEACIPAGSKQLSNTHMGTADDSLDVTVYEYPLKFADMMGNIYFTFTNKLCVPVGDTVTGSRGGVGFMASVGYTGIEPGIKDPRVFDKPRECSSFVEEIEMDLYEKFGFVNHKISSLFQSRKFH
ncbi:ependymin-related protein 1-like [Ostrea edulis]|uniref:ependymin-related protein 1-like n=1 Tax=Ostrea edulis TaxID=37623 RepID=UPI0024AEC227|nr:ependymin-related protein 1-like [Ostrea edulis]